jgi:hypothetical protein
MRSSRLDCRIRSRWIAALAAGGLLLLAQPALSQNAPTPLAPASPPDAAFVPQPAPPPQPVEKPGLFEAIGRWMDRGNDTFRTRLRGAKRQIDTIGSDAAENSRDIGKGAVEVGQGAVDVTKGAVEATRGAVDAMVKLPVSRVMRGHEQCAVAANGAPDCLVAAAALCRKHGYASGKSMDFTSAEECPPRVLLSGRQSDNECRTVTFISSAMCQ